MNHYVIGNIINQKPKLFRKDDVGSWYHIVTKSEMSNVPEHWIQMLHRSTLQSIIKNLDIKE